VEISTDPISGDHGDPENVTVFRRSRGGKLPPSPAALSSSFDARLDSVTLNKAGRAIQLPFSTFPYL